MDHKQGKELMALFRRLAGLRPGWDSYGACALSPVAVQRAIVLMRADLPIPAVVPTRAGGIQMEWHRHGIDVEINVPPTGDIEYLVVDPERGVVLESTGSTDQATLFSTLARIAVLDSNDSVVQATTFSPRG